MKVLASEQIVGRLRTLHPDHRNELPRALEGLANNRGDVKELAGSLSGFYRLRIGRYRIVYRYEKKRIEAIFLEHRSIVYELFHH